MQRIRDAVAPVYDRHAETIGTNVVDGIRDALAELRSN